MKSKERCRGYGKFSYNVFFPLKLLRATGEVGKEVKENCGNIKSLRYLRIFFFPFEVFFVCENLILLFGSETTEENAGADAEQKDC